LDNLYLIEGEELFDLIQAQSVFVIDTRDPLMYQRGHLPGAVNVPEIFTYLCLTENGGYPAMAQFLAKRMGEVGLKRSDPVVIYEDALDNGYGQSCRGWFLLKYLSHPSSVRVLHGGLRAWLAKSMPVVMEIPQYEQTDYIYQVNSSIMLSTEQMLAAIHDPAVMILDVRDYAEWNGANSSPYGYNFCPRKGRIPGARWLEWYRLMRHKNGIPWFRSPEEILGICEELEITPSTRIYLYCFKGARTSNTMLALKNAGIKDVRNYFMAWNEWSRDNNLPIDEGYPDS
jgi:thiosulfate/3-mercaptopyruvate sulfurtransferase